MSKENKDGLEPIAAQGIGYALEKVAAVTGSALGERTMAGGGVDVLTKAVSALQEFLNESGRSGDDFTNNARYILSRVQDYLDDAPDRPNAKDLAIMSGSALGHEIRELQELANELR